MQESGEIGVSSGVMLRQKKALSSNRFSCWKFSCKLLHSNSCRIKYLSHSITIFLCVYCSIHECYLNATTNNLIFSKCMKRERILYNWCQAVPFRRLVCCLLLLGRRSRNVSQHLERSARVVDGYLFIVVINNIKTRSGHY